MYSFHWWTILYTDLLFVTYFVPMEHFDSFFCKYSSSLYFLHVIVLPLVNYSVHRGFLKAYSVHKSFHVDLFSTSTTSSWPSFYTRDFYGQFYLFTYSSFVWLSLLEIYFMATCKWHWWPNFTVYFVYLLLLGELRFYMVDVLWFTWPILYEYLL